MKKILFSITLLWAATSWSGEPSYVFDSNDYDQSTGLLIIKVITNNDKDGLISSYEHQITNNLFIYDPITKKGRKLFDKYYGEVTGYILESSLTNDGHIEYIGTSSDFVKNNKNVKARPIKSSMLIETFNNSTRQYSVWKTEKPSGSPVVMFSYTKPSSWHIDARAGIVRVIVQDHENIIVKEYVW